MCPFLNPNRLIELSKRPGDIPGVVAVKVSPELTIDIYPPSIHQKDEVYYFLGRTDGTKYLWLLASDQNSSPIEKFTGELLMTEAEDDFTLKKCPLNHANAEALRQVFEHTRPSLIGLPNSFGLGDRLGIASPGHIRAIRKTNLKPVLAQQSIRELKRTQREPEEVMDAASWAVFQEGYREGFGADADHLKTTADIDYMIKAGFTMFTFDSGDHIDNQADTLSLAELERRATKIDWAELQIGNADFFENYVGHEVSIDNDYTIKPSREEVLRAVVKFSRVITYTSQLHQYLRKQYPDHPQEIELSVDEADSVTRPFEHFMIVSELKRLGVNLISFAPRFIGHFEKGIDYKGDLNRFRDEYLKHQKIATYLGPYKLSIHSGSDKFSVYRVMGSLRYGYFHVKTAGTSYLEALRTIAKVDPSLFIEILEYSRELYETEKRTYHVSADLAEVPTRETVSTTDLAELLDDHRRSIRQVLHVAFGRVLCDRDKEGKYIFRDRLIDTLVEHEEEHFRFLQKHFQRHLELFTGK